MSSGWYWGVNNVTVFHKSGLRNQWPSNELGIYTKISTNLHRLSENAASSVQDHSLSLTDYFIVQSTTDWLIANESWRTWTRVSTRNDLTVCIFYDVELLQGWAGLYSSLPVSQDTQDTLLNCFPENHVTVLPSGIVNHFMAVGVPVRWTSHWDSHCHKYRRFDFSVTI